MDLGPLKTRLQPMLQPLADIFRAQAVLYDRNGHPAAWAGDGASPPLRNGPGDPVRLVQERAVVLAADRAGGSSVCQSCARLATCQVTAELLVPVVQGGEVIATLGLLGHSPEARLRMLESRAAALQLLQHTGEAMVLWLARWQKPDRAEVLRRYLALALQGMGRPVLALDSDLVPIAWNELAAGALEPLARHPGSVEPLEVPDELARQVREGRRSRRAAWGRLTAEVQPVHVDDRSVGALVLFRDADEERPARSSPRRQYTFADLRGANPAFLLIKDKALRAAQTESTVLILGESGTGKEIFARAIHAASSRQGGPFVAVNCAAIPDNLLESELFGYEEGAFTGARRGGKLGKVQLADGGTLFLDEIGDLPLHLQAKLLRVLQFKEVEPVGATDTVPVDFRLIAATNQQVEDLIAQGRFRADLYYRLNVFPLVIPPLRDRKDDIYILLTFLGKKWSFQTGQTPKRWSAESLNVIFGYHWPGNVRELENTVEYAYHMCSGEMIGPECLPERMLERVGTAAASAAVPDPATAAVPVDQIPPPAAAPRRSRAKAIPPEEAEAIRAALDRRGETTEGKEQAARDLGISLATLYRKLKRMQGNVRKRN